MENRKPILDELKELSPALAQINPATPYQAPQGYFEGLPETMLSLIQADEASTVLSASRQNPYSVPVGYFDNLVDTILNKIKAAEGGSAKEELEFLSPLLGKLNKSNPYTLPAGYFEELPGNITEGAKAIELVNEELENLSELMSSLKTKKTYQAPQNYFAGLAEEILVKAKQQQSAKVISMNVGRKMLRYAAAAMVTGIIVIAGWFVMKPGTDPLKNISDTELQEYVENQDGLDNSDSNEEFFELDAADVKDMLADVSDEELQQYVEQTTSETNNAVTN